MPIESRFDPGRVVRQPVSKAEKSSDRGIGVARINAPSRFVYNALTDVRPLKTTRTIARLCRWVTSLEVFCCSGTTRLAGFAELSLYTENLLVSDGCEPIAIKTPPQKKQAANVGGLFGNLRVTQPGVWKWLGSFVGKFWG